MPPGIRAAWRLSCLVAALMTFAAAFGLLARSPYRDNALVSAAWRGNDFVALGVALPVFVGAIRTDTARKG